jgi:hypothetical protein
LYASNGHVGTVSDPSKPSQAWQALENELHLHFQNNAAEFAWSVRAVWGRPPSAVQAGQGSAGFALRPPLRSSATVKPAPKLIFPEIFTTLAVAPGNPLNLHFRNKAAKFAQRSKNKISFPGPLHQFRSPPCGEAALHCMQTI